LNPPELGFPTEAGEPVFAEPWQAQAFALVVQLYANGAFSWREWADALAQAIAAEPHAPYYDNWVRALEQQIRRLGLADADQLAERKAAWAEAYRTTPHGKPVELARR
jgi:nitrile hydratase accessory protein